MIENGTPRVSLEYDGSAENHIDIEYGGTVDHAVVEMPDVAPEESLVDDLPASMDFEVMAFGGQATVCAAAPKQGRRSTAYQSEAEPPPPSTWPRCTTPRSGASRTSAAVSA